MAKPARTSGGWIVTFGDLMALLLTFFVLMLSFSTLDAKKYEEVARAFARAFTGSDTILPGRAGIVGGAETVAISLPPADGPSITLPAPPSATETSGPPAKAARRPPSPSPAAALHAALSHTLAARIAEGTVSVEARGGNVILRMTEAALFETGEAAIDPAFLETLDRITAVLMDHGGKLVVSGHTDDRPIRTARYRSNWDLSAARAVSVVHYLLARSAIPPRRIVAQGRADSAPLLPNDSETRRAVNRRVDITILPENP